MLNNYSYIPGKVLGVILVAVYMVAKGRHLLRSGTAMKTAIQKLMQPTVRRKPPSYLGFQFYFGFSIIPELWPESQRRPAEGLREQLPHLLRLLQASHPPPLQAHLLRGVPRHLVRPGADLPPLPRAGHRGPRVEGRIHLPVHSALLKASLICSLKQQVKKGREEFGREE